MKNSRSVLKKIFLSLFGVIVLSFTLILTGCGNQANKPLSNKSITVGVTAGPHQQILEQIKNMAAKDGLNINIKSFTDYNTPNLALQSNNIQASSYETGQFLATQSEQRGFKFHKAFKTVALPMGVYSNKIKSLNDLKDGDKIAVPNDATQEERALKIFQDSGIIKLKSGLGQNVTKNDITYNPKHLKLYELDASQIPKQLNEFGAAATNSNFALQNNLTLNKSIAHEPFKNNSWPNYFVVRNNNKDDKVVKQIQKYYQSPEIKRYIQKEFKGALIPQW